MKLWLDDVRSAPEGWLWAGTARNAIALICEYGPTIDEVSLDHDLGALPEHGLYARGFAEESGQMVAGYIAASHILPTSVPIRVHSWNPDGATRMAAVLQRAGYDVEIRPYRIGE